MVTFYTSEHLLMQYFSIMDGDQLTFPPTVLRQSFTVEHALIGSFGGFLAIRHNELRDVTANLLSQVCTNVQV